MSIFSFLKRNQNNKITKITKTVEQFRTWVQNDGGDMIISSIDLKNKKIVLKVSGACIGCDLFDDTFNVNVKNVLLKKFKFIKEVIFETEDEK